jgi:hypothetical protein
MAAGSVIDRIRGWCVELESRGTSYNRYTYEYCRNDVLKEIKEEVLSMAEFKDVNKVRGMRIGMIKTHRLYDESIECRIEVICRYLQDVLDIITNRMSVIPTSEYFAIEDIFKSIEGHFTEIIHQVPDS